MDAIFLNGFADELKKIAADIDAKGHALQAAFNNKPAVTPSVGHTANAVPGRAEALQSFTAPGKFSPKPAIKSPIGFASSAAPRMAGLSKVTPPAAGLGSKLMGAAKKLFR